jgi:hypothetical protein
VLAQKSELGRLAIGTISATRRVFGYYNNKKNNNNMTAKRRKKLNETLSFLMDIERELTSQGKRLSRAFCAMKDDVLKELAA